MICLIGVILNNFYPLVILLVFVHYLMTSIFVLCRELKSNVSLAPEIKDTANKKDNTSSAFLPEERLLKRKHVENNGNQPDTQSEYIPTLEILQFKNSGQSGDIDLNCLQKVNFMIM